MATSQDPTADEHGRSGRRVRKWFLLDGHRGLVAGFVAVVFFAFALGITTSPFAPLRDSQPLFYLFGALLGGNITLVTVVVAINQLVLSRELNRPGELRSQIQGIVDYRTEVREETGRLPPAEPQGFLRLLVDSTRERARHLRSSTSAGTGEDVAEAVDELLSRVTAHLDQVDAILEESGASTFAVLSELLTTDYAHTIYELKRIEFEHGERLTRVDVEAIDELVDRFEEINVARQYFKTIYLQEELAGLSRLLFSVGIPAVAVLAGAFFLFTAPGGASVSRPVLAVLLPVLVTIGFVPLFVLFAFILRVATVAQRTAATAPFTTPAQER